MVLAGLNSTFISPLFVQFSKGKEFGNSTSREAFSKYSHSVYLPDSSTRRRGLLRNDVSGENLPKLH